jgi:hypothetical protein
VRRNCLIWIDTAISETMSPVRVTPLMKWIAVDTGNSRKLQARTDMAKAVVGGGMPGGPWKGMVMNATRSHQNGESMCSDPVPWRVFGICLPFQTSSLSSPSYHTFTRRSEFACSLLFPRARSRPECGNQCHSMDNTRCDSPKVNKYFSDFLSRTVTISAESQPTLYKADDHN